ncbi:MAG: PVC-type heme-binding CxxCH protein, partial [Planctomycetota bacterium]
MLRSRAFSLRALCLVSFALGLHACSLREEGGGAALGDGDLQSGATDLPPPQPEKEVRREPVVEKASDEGLKAIRRFTVPDGYEVALYAAEPLLANPVAFCTDNKGRFYVAETYRLSAGVTDTRRHMYWLDDDMACRTVEDRVAKYRKHLGEKFESYSMATDRVRRIEDVDGDGVPDSATVFSTGYSGTADGLGAGVLAYRGDVWFACLPDLWLLRDEDGDGHAEKRHSLHNGYGVHTGFLGHDLHGLRFGPDGRLYFSIGDRGVNLTTREGTKIFEPDVGLVFRCEPDGTKLEVFARGLRNPQELVFNDRGDLFTGENNSDSGDKARWVHLVEGGDCGWRIGFQFITEPVSRGPWNREKLWYPRFEGQAANIIPPIANIGDGPSGLTYHPGVTAFPDRLRDTFFLCDFRGDSTKSGIRAIQLEPQGASYRLETEEKLFWGILATDVDFCPDGSLAVSDWVTGWEVTGKGRIYKFFDPPRMEDPAVLEVQKLLADGF